MSGSVSNTSTLQAREVHDELGELNLDDMRSSSGKYEIRSKALSNCTSDGFPESSTSNGHHYIGYHPTPLLQIKEPLHNAEGIAFIPDYRIIVADKHDDHVWIFSAQGDQPTLLVKGVKPTGIATNKNSLIAFLDVKDKKHAVVKVFFADGTLKSSFGADLMWHPHGIAISDDDLIVVTDLAAKDGEVVRVFSLDGEILSKFGSYGRGKEQFREPFYVIVDCKLRILVSDKANNCIKGFSLKGEYLGKMGSHGSSEGHLTSPRGLAEDMTGNILVCDSGNRRVSAFTHNGHFIKHIMQASEGVQHPIDIDCHRKSGKIAVSMQTTHGEFYKIKVYTVEPQECQDERKHQVVDHHIGYHPELFAKIKEPLQSAEGVAVLPDHRIIVADKHNEHVHIFSPDGEHHILLAKAVKPTGVATNRNGVIAFLDVRDKRHASIKVYNSDGSERCTLGAGLTWHPHGIALSDDDLIVVTDLAAKAGEVVRVFSLDGEILSKFGEYGEGKEQLREPYHVIVDCKLRILVCDKAHNCIKGFSLKGKYLGKMGSHGSSEGHLTSPRGLAEDIHGNILVCDAGNRRVTAFTHDGHFIKHVLQATEGVHHPTDIDCHRMDGVIVVAMLNAHGEFHKVKVYQIPQSV